MSERFERFAKMAQEEFGLTVVKSASHENYTFEDLFGVSIESLTQYELPKTSKGENSMTNREWMESLSDNDLAAFLTTGLFCECLWAPKPQNKFVVNVQSITNRYTHSQIGIAEWLERRQEFKKA